MFSAVDLSFDVDGAHFLVRMDALLVNIGSRKNVKINLDNIKW